MEVTEPQKTVVSPTKSQPKHHWTVPSAQLDQQQHATQRYVKGKKQNPALALSQDEISQASSTSRWWLSWKGWHDQPDMALLVKGCLQRLMLGTMQA